MVNDYRTVNRANWDDRAPVHAASRAYGLARFAEDPGYLSDVVRFDMARLGDITGVEGVHLQCHLGTDTVSLARLGARMTGLDFSGPALGHARALAESAGLDIGFVEGEVYDAVEALCGRRFDLVYTGIGALCWLPDIRAWASVVASLLAPGGRLFLREGHPMLWAVDESRSRADGLLTLELPYFEREEPTVWDDGGTYVDADMTIEHGLTYQWNHGLGEIVGALLAEGLILTMLEEHDSAPWDVLPGRTVRNQAGEFRLANRPWRLPLTYTLQAVKPVDGVLDHLGG